MILKPTNQMPKVVSIGGGQGASIILSGLRAFSQELSGVISVTDTGRSTGKIRSLAGIPAPGDLRNALATLADDNDLVKLLQYRFDFPEFEPLDGMAFGNLMIAALTQMTGDFAKAVSIVNKIVNVSVDIMPVTTSNTHLCARLVDGTILNQEFNVRRLGKAPIEKVFIEDPSARAYPQAISALCNADIITLGPGSLFTTLLACLAFPEISQAIRESNAMVIYVCNTTTQPGQTDGYTAFDHVRQIISYLGPNTLDYVIINTKLPAPDVVKLYEADGVYPLVVDQQEIDKIYGLGVKPILAEVAETIFQKRNLWQKQDSIRHDSGLVADAIMKVWNQGSQM